MIQENLKLKTTSALIKVRARYKAQGICSSFSLYSVEEKLTPKKSFKFNFYSPDNLMISLITTMCALILLPEVTCRKKSMSMLETLGKTLSTLVSDKSFSRNDRSKPQQPSK